MSSISIPFKNSRDALLDEYMQAHKELKHTVGIDVCNKLLELEPENYRFYHLRAEQYLGLGISDKNSAIYIPAN